MTSARWWSQPFAPEGSQAAEGIANQLGRPALDPLEVLVREAAQNSWDARTGSGVVRFRISLQHLGARSVAWQQALLPSPDEGSIGGLAESLQEDSLVWIISDRGTAGLGGPIRAGTKAAEGEASDFVQFLRNVGEPRDTQLGGGTYGFGKGIFYRLSAPGIIMADSRAGSGDGRRLMGAAIGTSYYVGNQRFTGRHWWGIVDDNIPDPLLGVDADAMSSKLGLPGFEDHATGTDIVVLGAELGVNRDETRRTPEDAAVFVASAILWQLWPKLVGSDSERIDFAVDIDGVEVPIPHPDTVDQLVPFVEALREVRAQNGTPLIRTVEPRHVGDLAISLSGSAAEYMDEIVRAAQPFEQPSHHIARMRQAELVVDYREGPLHPNPSLAYGGVFRASIEADSNFAAAEPPTHDNWIEKGLSGTDRGVVQGARLFIQRRLSEMFDSVPLAHDVEKVGLAALSNRLGRLVDRAGLDTDSGQRGGSANSRGAGKGRDGDIRVVEATRLVVDGGRPFFVTRIAIRRHEAQVSFMASAIVRLAGGGTESEPPLDAPRPSILQWAPVAGGPPVPAAGITLGPSSEDSEWWVYANFVPLAVVDISVKRVV